MAHKMHRSTELVLAVVCACLLGKYTHSTKNEVSMAEKDGSTKTWGKGDRPGVSELESISNSLVPTGGLVLMSGGRGWKWHLPAPLFWEECPCHPYLYDMLCDE